MAQLARLEAPRVYEQQAATPTPAPIQEERMRLSDLPEAERNRMRCEREFLSLCAQNPEIAMEHAGALAQLKWHSNLYGQVAGVLLQVLGEDPNATAALLVTRATEAYPQAASILTSAQSDAPNPQRLARFLSEELAIGDQEEAIEALQGQLNDPSLSPEESDLYFNLVVSMQAELKQMRQAHKPI